VDETFENTDSALELLVLEGNNQPLEVLIFILVAILLAVFWILVCILRLKRKSAFAKDLSGTTI